MTQMHFLVEKFTETLFPHNHTRFKGQLKLSYLTFCKLFLVHETPLHKLTNKNLQNSA